MLMTLVLGVVAIYCLARSFADFRQRRYIWAGLGALAAAALLVIPGGEPTAVTVNIPDKD